MAAPANRIEEIFDSLINCPAAERAQQCARLCGDDSELRSEVLSLLEAHEKANGFLSVGSSAMDWLTDHALDTDAMLGQRFGSYQIVRELDSGGMGVVFLAERIDGHYQQQVAIKLAKYGLKSDVTLQRFHTERQILANLQHPNIAQLLDGGTNADGHPYLVMEFTPGEPIDQYCHQQHLSIHQILRLVSKVCSAVQYAHQSLTVHCDLKPANIMITTGGVPKLLDFGIAKLLRPASSPINQLLPIDDDETNPLTPEFAAPEQLNGHPITTATDVYALGMLLYKLLSGKLPYTFKASSLADTAHYVSNIDIPAPSSVAPRTRKQSLQGDLDRIVLKALSKNPQQRYASVELLASDIERFLCALPVSASNRTWTYLCGKFINRHRWGVGFASLTVASLVAGTVISTWQWRTAQHEKMQADQRFQDVRELTSTMVFELPETIASLPGTTKLRERLLQKGTSYLDSLAHTNHDDPALLRDLATAYNKLGRLQGNPANSSLGDPDIAFQSLNKALSLREELLADNPDDDNLRIDVSVSYIELSKLYATEFDDLDRAHALSEKCIALVSPLASTGEVKAVNRLQICYSLAAHWRNVDGHHAIAARHLRNAAQMLDDLSPDHEFHTSFSGYRTLARMHEEWAEIAAKSGDFEQALKRESERLAIVLEHMQNRQSSARLTGSAYHGYAARLAAKERFSDAKNAYEKAIELWKALQDNYPADVTTTRTLAVLFAELAELHLQIAHKVPIAHIGTEQHVKVCEAYKRSVSNLEKLPNNKTKYPVRYSWSPTPAYIYAQYEKLCSGQTVAELRTSWP